MVKKLTNVTSLTGNGLRDWLVQRMTSLVLLVYIVFLLSFILLQPTMNYVVWRGLFSHTAMRVWSSLFLLSLVWHAWVGLWTIVGDYIKPLALRLAAQTIVIIALWVYLIWGLSIFWTY